MQRKFSPAQSISHLSIFCNRDQRSGNPNLPNPKIPINLLPPFFSNLRRRHRRFLRRRSSRRLSHRRPAPSRRPSSTPELTAARIRSDIVVISPSFFTVSAASTAILFPLVRQRSSRSCRRRRPCHRLDSTRRPLSPSRSASADSSSSTVRHHGFSLDSEIDVNNIPIPTLSPQPHPDPGSHLTHPHESAELCLKKLGKLKGELIEADDALVKALAVVDRKNC